MHMTVHSQPEVGSKHISTLCSGSNSSSPLEQLLWIFFSQPIKTKPSDYNHNNVLCQLSEYNKNSNSNRDSHCPNLQALILFTSCTIFIPDFRFRYFITTCRYYTMGTSSISLFAIFCIFVLKVLLFLAFLPGMLESESAMMRPE